MTSASVWIKLYIGNENFSLFKIRDFNGDVDDLKKEIKKEKKPELDYLAADRLDIYPAETAVPIAPGTVALLEDDNPPTGTTRANPLIVTSPKRDDDSRDGKRPRRSYENYEAITSAKKYAEAEWKEQQKRGKTRIMHLRPPGCSYLPVFIIHEAFNEMTQIIEQDEEFEAPDYALLDALLTEMGRAFRIEDKRRDAINKILNNHLFINLNAPIGVANIASGTTDGTSEEAGVNIEFKNEKGKGDCDPYLQNSAYYVHYWSDKGNVDEEEKKVRGPEKHCCPWILVEVLGQEMGLSGAVFANGVPCVQPLTCNVPFLHAPMGKHLRKSQLRLCKALRVGATRLRDWYSSPERNVVSIQAQFPYLRTYTDTNGMKVSFEYTKCLKGEGGSVFVAKRAGDAADHILVKFVERYGEEVHRMLSDLGLAPKLLAVEKVHAVMMVVMDFESDAVIWDPVSAGANDETNNQLKTILEKLTEHSYVHGDMRSDNLLVCTGGKVKLIDFDWAGKDGVVRYPVELNPAVKWHADASIGKVIRIEHDAFMAGQLMQ